MITIKTTIIMIVFKVGFNYKMELVSDNNYGALNLTTNKWNGLVRVFHHLIVLNVFRSCYLNRWFRKFRYISVNTIDLLAILLLFACFSFYPRFVEKLKQCFP